MSDLHILLDLANMSSFSLLRNPNRHLVGSHLDPLIDRVVANVLRLENGTHYDAYRIRVYDGWFESTRSESPLYGVVRDWCRNTYPARVHRKRVTVEVADSLLARPLAKIENTLRRTAGISKHFVKLSPPPFSGCAAVGSCPAVGLASWLKRSGGCPQSGCSVLTTDVCSYREQKLVDTSLVADAIWLAAQGDDVAIWSDDEDMIPGLVTASGFRKRVLLISMEESVRPAYYALLENCNIEVVDVH